VEIRMATKTAKIVKRQTGSEIVKCLEVLYAAMRKRHPELPEVVMVTGSGIANGSGKWAHVSIGYHWEDRLAADGTEPTESHKRNEMFIAGERLACGVEYTLQTMLHECAHLLNVARDVQDCSRQGRYHNMKFVEAAREMGLDYTCTRTTDKGKTVLDPNPTLGFSAVELVEETKIQYKRELDQLDKAIRAAINDPFALGLVGKNGGSGGTGGGDGSHTIGRKTKAPGTVSRNNVKYVCECEKPRIMRMAASVFADGPISCGMCGSDFHEES
jgi:hypothetical protein